MTDRPEAAEMMTYADVAALTGLKPSTLYSMVHRRRIPHFRLGGRLVRFRRSELMTWLEACHVPAHKET